MLTRLIHNIAKFESLCGTTETDIFMSSIHQQIRRNDKPNLLFIKYKWLSGDYVILYHGICRKNFTGK